jgi:hypothetical protein
MQNKKNLDSSFGYKNVFINSDSLLDFASKKSYFNNFDIFSNIPLKFLL